ncbi:hypothetical protein ACLESO_21685 [Pyxidicoccus sp. 3LG]
MNAMDFVVRRQGPRVLQEIVKARMWPEGADARLIERVNRLPPFRKGTDEMLHLAKDLGGLSMALIGFDEGHRRPPGDSEEKRGMAVVGVGAVAEALDKGHALLDAQPPRGDASLIEGVGGIFHARGMLEGETKSVVDTAVGFLNEMVKLARKGAPRSP